MFSHSLACGSEATAIDGKSYGAFASKYDPIAACKFLQNNQTHKPKQTKQTEKQNTTTNCSYPGKTMQSYSSVVVQLTFAIGRLIRHDPSYPYS